MLLKYNAQVKLASLASNWIISKQRAEDADDAEDRTPQSETLRRKARKEIFKLLTSFCRNSDYNPQTRSCQVSTARNE